MTCLVPDLGLYTPFYIKRNQVLGKIATPGLKQGRYKIELKCLYYSRK